MSEGQQNGVNNNEKHNDDSQKATPREVTQTDQLNKKLLMSLFDRMSKGDETLQRMMRPEDNGQQSDGWDTSPGDFSPK